MPLSSVDLPTMSNAALPVRALLSAVAIGCVSLPLPLFAQDVVPDATLGIESSVVTEVNTTTDLIEGGALRNSTLFHSFSEFGIADGHRVDFANPTGVNTIFSRVTGNNPSLLFGTLGVLGDADLVFLNPNGVLFGPNAQLDLNGAFTVSTATGITFPGGETFDAGNPGPAPLLTVNVQAPVGVVFEGSENPAAIINQADLAIDAGQDLTVIGGSLFNSGNLTSPGGNVNLLAATGNSLINWGDLDISHLETGEAAIDVNALSFSELIAVTGWSDVEGHTWLNPGAVIVTGAVDVSDALGAGGEIALNGDRLQLDGRLQATGTTGGRINLSGRLIQNQGQVVADGEQGGVIGLNATNVLDAGLLSAIGTETTGGAVQVDYTGTVIQTASAETIVDGNTTAGSIDINGGRVLTTSGTLQATGPQGGEIQLFGERVQVLGAQVTANGTEGGGDVLVGGEFQGNTPDRENAQDVVVTHSAMLSANATETGDGGRVIVWADGETQFYGEVSARGGAFTGDGGLLEVSGRETLVFAGFGDASAENGLAGALLLDPKNITIATAANGNSFQLFDPNPAPGNQFGYEAVVLANNNIVVSSPNDDFSAQDAGAIYLFDQNNGLLIGQIFGTNSFDHFGSRSIIELNNGNYVFGNPFADINGLTDAGTVILADATTGTEIDRISGSNLNDRFGQESITSLDANSYVFGNPLADINSIEDAGVVILANNDTGSEIGRIPGENPGDGFGGNDVTILSNGNYVFGNPLADVNGVEDAGIVILASRTTGLELGRVFGENSQDRFSQFSGVFFSAINITALSDGNYVFGNPLADINGVDNAGTVILVSGVTGLELERISGVNEDDRFGFGLIVEISNGNYAFTNPFADINNIENAGTVILASNITGQELGRISGINKNDRFGSGLLSTAITPLNNGNYIFGSPRADIGGVENAGTVILADGSTGQELGRISGANRGDSFGDTFITELDNENFVFSAPVADVNGFVNSGTVILADGLSGDEINRISGIETNDHFGGTGTVIVLPVEIAPLSNGNYVFSSADADIGGIENAGAVILSDGSTGREVERIVGVSSNDNFGVIENSFVNNILTLNNSDFVFANPSADINGVTDAGTVILADGVTGNEISRISGSNIFDQLGSGNTTNLISALDNGNYLVFSPNANNNAGRIDVGIANPNTLTYSYFPERSVTLTPSIITNITDTGTDVTLQASNDININENILTTNPSGIGGSLILQAGRSIIINADITTDNGNLTLIANDTLANGVVNAHRDPGFAEIRFAPGSNINAGSGTVTLTLDDGAGLTNSDNGDITLANITAESLSINSNGRIFGEGNLNIDGDATFITAASGAGSVRVNSIGANTTIGTSAIGGTLYVDSNGLVSQVPGEILQAIGGIIVNGGGSAPVNNVIGNPNQTVTLPNGDVVITQVGTVDLNSASYTGNLTVNSLASGVLAFDTVLTEDAIVLGQANNFGGILRFTTSTGNATTITGTPGINQDGPLTVAGTATFNAGNGNIRLDEFDNQFLSTVDLTGSDVTLRAQSNLNVGPSTITGDLNLTTAGTLTQSGAISVDGATNLAVTLSGAGNVTLNSSADITLGESLVGGTLTLLRTPISQVDGESVLARAVSPIGAIPNPGNVIGVQTSGTDVVITDVGSIDLAINTPGSLTINSANISQTVPYSSNLTVNSVDSAIGFSGNNNNALAIDLSNAGNAFAGPIRITTEATTFDVQGPTLPDITQSGTNPLIVNNTATFNAIDGQINLPNQANQFGILSFNGSQIDINEADDIVLGQSAVLDSTLDPGLNPPRAELRLSAGGDIVQLDSLQAEGTSLFESRQVDGNIVLNQANQLEAPITLITNGAGDVTVTNTVNETQLASTTLGGNLTVSSGGGISQTGPISVVGEAEFNAGSSAIELNDSGNDFNRITISGGGSADIADVNDISLGDSLAYGDFTINAAEDITTGSITTSNGSISLESTNGGIDTTNGELIAIYPSGQGGDIEVRAPRNLRLGEITVSGFTSGSVVLSTDSELILDGSDITSINFGDTEGGDIRVLHADIVRMIDGGRLLALVQGPGDGGDIVVNTRQLVVQGDTTQNTGIGANISNGASGRGGDVEINATESVDLIGADPTGFTPDPNNPLGAVIQAVTLGTGISTSTFGFGNAGNLTINTRYLRARDGAGATTSTSSTTANAGNGGTLTINAQTVDFIGTSGLATATVGPGDAGTIIVNSHQVSLSNGATISADALRVVSGTLIGAAGDIRFANVAGIRLNTLGRISTSSSSGNGGNIFMENIGLLELNGGNGVGGIFTDGGVSGSVGNGGRIVITADNIVADSQSNTDISAGAYRGIGGGINVSVRYLSGIEFRDQLTPLSEITAASQFGQSGTVNIQDENLDPTQGIDALPVEPRGPEAIQSCQLGNSPSATFFDHGRGGLLPRPEDLLTVDSILVEWLSLELAEGSNVASAVPVSEEPQLLAACGVDEGV